jgi:hypothetical protein
MPSQREIAAQAFDAVEKGAKRYDSDVEVTRGRAEFLGTQKQDGSDREQRDDARSVYRGHIDQSPVQGGDREQRDHSREAYEKISENPKWCEAAELWKGVRDRCVYRKPYPGLLSEESAKLAR